MKTITKQVAALGIALAALGTSFEAAAVCTATGKIRAIYSYAVGANNYSYIYFDPQSETLVPGYTWYARVEGSDTTLISALAAAHAGGHTIRLYGNATSCPAVPTAPGYRYIGVAEYGYAYSQY